MANGEWRMTDTRGWQSAGLRRGIPFVAVAISFLLAAPMFEISGQEWYT
jgi:hypothetical protein